VLVFRSGDSTVVTDAGQRRDARKRVAHEPAGAAAAAERLWTPDKAQDKGRKRVN
jgi:hypothetical protein